MKPTVNDMIKINAKAEKNWNSTWKEILERPDGTIDINQLKLELLDFSEMIDRMTTLTHRLSGGVLSYPTYPVETILEVHERVHEEEREREEKEIRDRRLFSNICDDEYECRCNEESSEG